MKQTCQCGLQMTDLTHGYGETRNYICNNPGNCGRHFFKGKWYTKQEWEAYVELD